MLAEAFNFDAEGLVVVARVARRRRPISDEMCKKLARLDTAFAVVGHLNLVKNRAFVEALSCMLAEPGFKDCNRVTKVLHKQKECYKQVVGEGLQKEHYKETAGEVQQELCLCKQVAGDDSAKVHYKQVTGEGQAKEHYNEAGGEGQTKEL